MKTEGKKLTRETKAIAAWEEWNSAIEEGSKYSAVGYADTPLAIVGYLKADAEWQSLNACELWPDDLADGSRVTFDPSMLSARENGLSLAGWYCDLFAVIGSGNDPRTGSEILVIQTLDDKGRVRRISIPRGLIAGNSGPFASFCGDKGFNLSVKPEARRHVQSLLLALKGPRIAITENTGWLKNTASFVLPSGKVIGEERRVIFTADKTGPANTVGTSGSYEDWKQSIAKTVPGNSRLELALCAGLYSPLMRFTGDPRPVIFNIHGESSRGKTTSGYVFGSVWGGDPTRTLRYAHSWNQTYNAFNALASSYSGIGLSLDEIQHIPDPDVAYSFSEGEDKGRLRADASQKAKRKWSAIAWSTGEKRLEDIVAEHKKTQNSGVQSGREARFFDIPVTGTGSHSGVVESLNGFAGAEELVEEISECTREHYGYAGPAFVEALADFALEHGEEALKAMVAEATEKVLLAFDLKPDANPLVKRVARAFAQVGAAGILAAEFGVIPNDAEELVDGVVKCFTDWLDRRGSQLFTRGEITSVVALRDYIQAKQHLFLNPNNTNEFKGQEIVGYLKKIDGKDCYLLTNKSWDIAQRNAKATDLAKSLDQRGLLVKAKGGRSKVQARVTNLLGRSVKDRFYAVSSEILSVNDFGDVVAERDDETNEDDGDAFGSKPGRKLSVVIPQQVN